MIYIAQISREVRHIQFGAPLVVPPGAEIGAGAATPVGEAPHMGQPTDIVLYQAEWCPYCARVRSKLTDLLLDYKTVNVPRSHAERGEVKAVSNQTGIPVMVDGDVTLDDDDDIIPYLDKKYGSKQKAAS